MSATVIPFAATSSDQFIITPTSSPSLSEAEIESILTEFAEKNGTPVTDSSFISIADETGELVLSFYGNGLALGFLGDNAFIERSLNWAKNHGITSGDLHQVNHLDGLLSYVVVRREIGADGVVIRGARQCLLDGLTAQFRAEIIHAGEVPLLKDEWDEEIGPIVEYNDTTIDRLARERAIAFAEERIVMTNFMSQQFKVAPVPFDLGTFERTGDEALEG